MTAHAAAIREPPPAARGAKDVARSRLFSNALFQIDLRVGLRCGGRLNIRGLITEPHAIAKMLAALGARAPPAAA